LNILIVRTDKLGDFVTTLPAISILKNYDAKNKIIVCVSPINKALASYCEFIDEVIVDDGCGLFELSKRFTDTKADVSITMFSNTRVAIAGFLARIQKRIAPATKLAQVFYTHRVKQRRSQVKMAEFEYNIELTKSLFPKINTNYKKPLLDFKTTDDTKGESICFHVGFGGSSDANWSLDEYEVLINATLKKHKVVLTFGPDETELMQNMKRRFDDAKISFYQSNDGIVEFLRYISGFKLFVSTSTGTYHLASLVGVPTMTFFGDSLFASSARWKGVGEIKLQQHFMLPTDDAKRNEMFEDVKEKLLSL